MFRPELIEVSSNLNPSTTALRLAAFFMVAEFLAVTACCGIALARAEYLALGDMWKILSPLVVYDVFTFAFCGYLIRKHWDMLLPSERLLREFYLISLLLRAIAVVAVSIACFTIPVALRGGLLVCSFGGTYATLHVLNRKGPKSGYITAKLNVWDLPIFIVVMQVWLRKEHFNEWRWSATFWPFYGYAILLALSSVVGSMSASSCHTRTFFQSLGVLALFSFWCLTALQDFLDGRTKAMNFCFPLFLLSLLLFFLCIAMAIMHVQHSQEEDDYVAMEDNADGPPIRRDESVFLESVSDQFYRTTLDLPNRIREWFRGRDSGGDGEEMQALSVRPFDFDTCNICCDNEADAVFLHCGHGGVCHPCATFMFHRSGECCICRSSVRGVAKITHKSLVAEPPDTNEEPGLDAQDESDAPTRRFVKAKALLVR